MPKIIKGPRVVTSPSGQFILPGGHVITTERQVTTEEWFLGVLVNREISVERETHEVQAPDPGMDGPEDLESSWPLRGTLEFEDRTFTVVRADDPTFWGFGPGGVSRTMEEFRQGVQESNAQRILAGAQLGWWEVDAQGDPQQLPLVVSIKAMMGENKTLMAHLMVDIKVFKSVGEAKRNGWDKPLQLGRHALGPRKKRVIVEIVE